MERHGLACGICLFLRLEFLRVGTLCFVSLRHPALAICVHGTPAGGQRLAGRIAELESGTVLSLKKFSAPTLLLKKDFLGKYQKPSLPCYFPEEMIRRY